MKNKAQGRAEQVAELRRTAVRLAEQGLSTAAISGVVRRKLRTVQLWLAEYRQHGSAALEPRQAPGAPPRLTGRQRAGLRRRIIAGALSQGFATELWTGPRVRELIQREYGVEYHAGYIPELLKPLGLSRRKPELQARERDPDAVESWKKVTWTRLKKERAA